LCVVCTAVIATAIIVVVIGTIIIVVVYGLLRSGPTDPAFASTGRPKASRYC
jgi:hypothetical protein